MSPRSRHSFFLDQQISDGLKALKGRDGVSEAEAVRRALTEFLERKGISCPKGDEAAKKRRSKSPNRK